jgi:hypothetical protein
MTSPHYILLTVKKITIPTPRGPAPSQSTMLNPVVRKLFPLPLSIQMAQHGREAEVDVGTGMVLTMAEDFNDVLAALESAAAAGKYIVRPMQRGAIQAAVFPMGRTGEQDIEDATTIVQAVHELASDFQDRVKEAVRAAEGSMHQGELVDELPAAMLAREMREGTAKFVSPDRAGPPTPRAVAAGDLRIATDGDRWWIEVANKIEACSDLDKPSYEWSRFGVPAELLPIYEGSEAAHQAVKLAGYIRRLVEA